MSGEGRGEGERNGLANQPRPPGIVEHSTCTIHIATGEGTSARGKRLVSEASV